MESPKRLKHRVYEEHECANPKCSNLTVNKFCCSRSCSGWYRRSKSSASIPGQKRTRKSLKDRFLGFFNGVEPPRDECWPWIGNYERRTMSPVISTRNKRDEMRQTHAARVAWELWRGPVPKGHIVLSPCEDVMCVNPYHSICGKRGRVIAEHLRITQHSSNPGERNNFKLPDSQVETIRGLHTEQDWGAIKALAEEYEMSYKYLMCVGRSRGRTRRALNESERERKERLYQ